MFVLEAENIMKTFGDRTLFRMVGRLEIGKRDRIGVVGVNGAGKSTLLAVLAGRVEPDAGTVRRRGSIAEIHQFEAIGEDELGDSRSGGERTRAAIAAALEKKANLLIADEPTSHLDGEGIVELERTLRDYDGAVLIISHDRTLLDTVCTRILEVENGELRPHSGGYTAYREQKERKLDRERFEYEQYEKEKTRLTRAAIEKAQSSSSMKKKPKRMSYKEANLGAEKARSRQAKVDRAVQAIRTRIDQLERKEAPKTPPTVVFDISYHQPVRSKFAVRLERANIVAGNRTLVRDLTLAVKPGMRLALSGPNGCGKSTLLSLIAAGGPGAKLAGSCKVGFFKQTLSDLKEDRTILQSVMDTSVYPEQTVRTLLARLLFRREEVFKPVACLSGGERVKTALARLFMSDCNVLLLDEPNNFLDLATLENLEEVLESYPGNLLFATHDRTFTRRVATHMLRFDGERCILSECGAGDGTPPLPGKASASADGSIASGQHRPAAPEGQKGSTRSSSPLPEAERLLLENELAGLIGRLSVARDASEKAELDRRYAETLAALRNTK